MPATIQDEPNKVCLLRISGVLKRPEFGAKQDVSARGFEAACVHTFLQPQTPHPR